MKQFKVILTDGETSDIVYIGKTFEECDNYILDNMFDNSNKQFNEYKDGHSIITDSYGTILEAYNIRQEREEYKRLV